MMADVGSGYRRRWAVLALVLAAECMDLLDGSIVNVAAPTISGDLHASTAALSGSSAVTPSPLPSA